MFWGIMASMFIGNVMLLILNMPLVGAFVQLLRIRAGIIGAVAVLITMVGVCTLNNRIFDMVVAVVAGVIAYGKRRSGFEPEPLVLSVILGGTLEANLRGSLAMSDGDPLIFLTRPVSLVLCSLFVIVIAVAGWQALRGRRQRATVPRS